ncbi:helix-turn-helix domain-containing protein [Aquimarina sp. MMG016]|uniref:AraC family transcriptional regulator n=1 Tax=Aquimarina sp. MMG016 TaxID=2822690 RepID=UPI001B3A436C|nr:helix-turn-helix domain-containing protein [Aquimarina sp. MMG016]MBQ4819482.1 AraC family transcriptional regulator [Aquimarina sp. MMG016]
MGLRIGKSVMLNFGNDLEPLFIFVGLSFMLAIGPLLKWYVVGMTKVNFRLPRYYFLELVPFCILFLMSLFVTKNWFESNDKEVIIVFAGFLIFIYLHFVFYIFLAGRIVKKIKKIYPKSSQTKSQSTVLSWLQLLIIGFILIWISYFLNIIDNAVPYITGPMMYSVVIYFLSFKAFQLKITEIDGNVFKKNENTELFHQLVQRIVGDKLYLDANVSLSSLSKLIHKSTQKTSEIINQNAKQNFNDFINHFRIKEAKKMLLGNKNHTISAIAFDAGFNSLSSFNSAFKKFEGTTPSLYRNNTLK